MEKPKQYYIELLDRYLKDQCTPEEVAALMHFFSDSASNRILLNEMQQQYTLLADKEGTMPALQSEKLRGILLHTIAPDDSARRPVRKLWLFISAAAAMLVLCVGMYLFYTPAPGLQQDKKKGTASLSPVHPGTQKAVLGFPGGPEVTLNAATQGILYNKDGLVISRTTAGDIKCGFSGNESQRTALQGLQVTLTTPIGGECRIVLADGSRIWLNAHSSLRFPAAFAKAERRVESHGEVYFEVARNAARPFRVVSGKQLIEVLGTHFVVNTNADNSVIKTTLLEGRIRLINGKVQKVLAPGQESKYSAAQGNIEIAVKENAATAAAWKDGYFIFDNADFKMVEEQISKWYGGEFVYDRLPAKLFYGKIERNVELSNVLKMLEIVSNIHFKTEGRRIYVTES